MTTAGPAAPGRAGARVAEAASPDLVSGVRRVGAAALAWVGEYRACFALPADVLDPGTDVNRTLKPLGELVQLTAPLRRRGAAPEGRRLAEDLLAHAWRLTREGRLFLDLARGEPYATYPFEIYAAFAEAGLRHPGYEAHARTVAGTRGWRCTEQDPNRRLGVLNSERRVGGGPHDDPGGALRRTWLGGLPEPWTFESAAGYTLTHVVFHATDWGRRPDALPMDITAYLDDWLPAWLDGCLENEQWDLAGELLAVAACLPRPPGAHTVAAWSALAAAQDDAGAIPETGAADRVPGGGRSFPACYHSTLVAVFASALTLAHPGHGTPRTPDRTGGVPAYDDGDAT